MKKRPTPTNGKPSAQNSAIVAEQPDGGRLALVNAAPRLSPRQARVINALLSGAWITRESLDRIAGASNSPDVIWKLRRKIGEDAFDMELIDGTDRDGRPCRTGRYRMTEQGRERLDQISANAGQGRSAA